MKLFILLDSNGVISGISESKDDIKMYKNKKRFANHQIHTIKDEDMINELLLHYEELYIENYEDIGLVLTRAESLVIEDILGEEKQRMKSVNSDLKHFIQNYDLKKNEKQALKEALKVIKKVNKTKRLTKTLKLDGFVQVHSSTKKIKDRLASTAKQMYVFITQKD